MFYHNDEQSHRPQYGHPPLLRQELLDRVDDVPGQQQLPDVTEGAGWVYLQMEQTPLSFLASNGMCSVECLNKNVKFIASDVMW